MNTNIATYEVTYVRNPIWVFVENYPLEFALIIALSLAVAVWLFWRRKSN